MTHPDVVASALGDEGVAARVDLGDSALFVTPTRTILYRAEKLLSDESVEEFPHGAERITVSEGRRKATLALDYGVDGERSLTVPSKHLDEALHPVLAGTLNAAGVTDPGETIKETFRFSELTLVVTSDRLVKHVGSAVWDEEFEEFHYDDVTDLTFEEGSVATTLVVTLGGRQERFKAPNERAREVRERLTEAVLDHHDVDSVATLRERFADEAETEEASSARMSFGDGPTPLSVNPGELAERPRNATRRDEDDPVDADADTDAAAEVGESKPVETETPDVTDPVEASDAPTGAATTTGEDADAGADGRGRAHGRSGAPGAETAADDRPANGTETDTAGKLLGPPTEAGGDVTTGTEPSPDADTDLASLVAEVEALRESVEAQNERLAHQEELIQQLIVELRDRV